MIRYVIVPVVLFAALAAAPPATRAGGNDVRIELNRLEERAAGCRVHLVLENDAARAYTSYRLDLVIFDADGVIARRVAVETAPLRASKTMVKEFELVDLPCARVGRILLNDVTRCASAAGELENCVAATRLSSRSAVPFVK